MTRRAARFTTLAAGAALTTTFAIAWPSTATAQDPATPPATDADPATTAAGARAEDDAAPPPISPADYGRWERLGSATLSDDGRWIAYGISRNNDEDDLRIRPLNDDDSLFVVPYGSGATFSADGRWAGYRIGVSDDEREALRRRNEPVRAELGLLDLESGDTTIVSGVSSFSFSGDGAYLAMRRYPPRGNGDDVGSPDLVVRDLATGIDTRFGDVADFAWQDDGSLLALVIDAEDDAANGVQLWDPRTQRLRPLIAEEAVFTGLAWRPADDDLAILRERTDDAHDDTTHVVLAWRDLQDLDEPETLRFDPDSAAGFPDGMGIVDHRRLRWAEDGSKLYFGIKERKPKPDAGGDGGAADSVDVGADAVPTPEDGDGGAEGAGDEEGERGPEDDDSPPADTTEASGDDEDDLDPPDVLVWHAKDVDIIPTQGVRASRDRRDNDLAVWHLDADRFVRLGDDRIEGVRVLEGDRLAIGTDGEPYEHERMFGPEYRDVYLIDMESGERRRVIERVQYFSGPSPEGGYLLYLEDDHYFAYDIERDRVVNLTAGLETSFVNLDDDHTVEQKPPFGAGGWLEDDAAVLLYDEYDIWRVAPDGSEAERLTNGAADSVTYRYIDLVSEDPPENDVIDPDAPAYLKVYDDWAEMHGYARMDGLGAEPERLLWTEDFVGWLSKADDAEVYLYRAEHFDDSPDYFVAGPDLRDAQRVTETNPFQTEYAWGRSELVEYENARGERLQGALFYPADYEPGRRYPMIVYIYETVSYSVNRYQPPSDESAYNTTVFTSDGYFVFQPDITYRARNPGLSAVEAIVPAVETVLETGMVDPERIGLMGHSWGGYQTAFTVTQTDIFRAAVAGAPLTNLVSMYNSIYWRTGGTDARIFEISQGRMEVPPWEDMESYVANSPLHNITRMDTPLLVGFGDDDGAVEFNQGVEFYNAARRAGKHLVMLVYEDENHGISRREEHRKDYHRRVKTWFDHYLKGETAPAWITEGVPYLEQMEERERNEKAGRSTT